MYAGRSGVEIAAHVTVGVYFIVMGVKNVIIRDDVMARMTALRVPLPPVSLAFGFSVQFAGATLVLLDFHSAVGALMLIAFVAAATVVFHRFWRMPDPVRRNYHMLLGLNNIGFIGALLLFLAH